MPFALHFRPLHCIHSRTLSIAPATTTFASCHCFAHRPSDAQATAIAFCSIRSCCGPLLVATNQRSNTSCIATLYLRKSHYLVSFTFPIFLSTSYPIVRSPIFCYVTFLPLPLHLSRLVNRDEDWLRAWDRMGEVVYNSCSLGLSCFLSHKLFFLEWYCSSGTLVSLNFDRLFHGSR